MVFEVKNVVFEPKKVVFHGIFHDTPTIVKTITKKQLEVKKTSGEVRLKAEIANLKFLTFVAKIATFVADKIEIFTS